MTEEPEVKVVEFEDAALFEIDGKRYELALEDSHLVHEIDARLAKIPASRYDMKDFTITVPYLFEVPGLHKYLDVDLSIACQPWDNQPDSYYVSTNLGIEQAHLRDKRENERVEEEKVVIDDDFERVEGRGDSYAIKQNDNWVVYGAYDVIDDPDAADHDSITYKIKNLDNFSELAGDVPVYVSSSSLDFSQGTNIFDKDHMVSARDMDQRQLKSVFITKDQVLKDAAKMLEKNGFALNQHNQEWLAKKMIERAGASHYGIESDIEYTNAEIADQLKEKNSELLQERIEGRGGSYAVKQNDNWVVHGTRDVIDDPEAKDYASVAYKIKDLDNFSELAGDVPVYVSDGTTAFDRNYMVSASDMEQWDFENIFITKDQVLKDAAKILEKNNFPATTHNQEWLAKEMIERAGASHYQMESDISYTNNEISDQLKYNVVDKFYTQLDGFYKDSRIEDNKHKVVDINDGRTLNKLILAVYGDDDSEISTVIRDLDYRGLDDDLKGAGMPRLDERDPELLQGDGMSYAEKVNGKWYVIGSHDADSSLPDNWKAYRLGHMTSDYLASLPNDAPLFTTPYIFGTGGSEEDLTLVAKVKPDNADYVTKKLLMTQTKELLENLEFPITEKNLNKIAQELLDQGNYGSYDAGTYDMVAWSDSIEDSFLNDYHTLQHSQLDGFYNDPQIEKVKNQKLVEDSNADMGVLFEGETISDFITAQHVYTEARSLDYKQLNKELERAGLERLDQKRLTPKFEAVIDGRPQVLSEHDVISRALNTIQQKYESDQAMDTVVDYLRNPNLNSPKKRLKLATKVLENAEHVKLHKLEKPRPISELKPFIKKSKER